MGDQGPEDQLAVTVSVDDAHLEGIGRVADDLRSRGMRVEHVLATLGTVTGTIASQALEGLRAVPGVSDVELAREIQLAPPDADIQ